ncbi:MAG: HAD-IC family P-type ATPase, partial [Thermomicrobiaceae bacterium]|nr:HAD-IC family P-type ATPase [Thermomicrobiaceae bacterium]
YGFDQRERLAAYVWRAPDGATWLFAKGAVEALVERAARDASEPQRFEPEAEALAARGERVLGVARRRLDAMTGDRHRDIADLDILGLVSFVDPPRPEVRAAITECAAAGVRVVLLSGDHPRTALAVAEAIGLDHRGRVVSGGEIEQADDAELARLSRSATVFARVLPGQKYRLVRALQAQDEVVAMTGDGINDAPALKAADIGVAMGQRGTEAARAAASMVLLDDNFATIVTAIREGRRIFDNLQRAFSYLVAFHIPIVLTALAIPLAGAPLLLLPVHLVWLELIVHPTASLLFEGDAPAPDLMRRPPRPRRGGLLPRAAALRALVEGVIITLIVAGIYLGWLARG